jgi:hypothetical protein
MGCIIMDKKRFTFIYFVVFLMCSHSAIGEEITLDLIITGYGGASDAEAIIQFYSEPSTAPSSRIISNESRNRYGHFESRIKTGFEMEEVAELYILGKIRNRSGEDVAYIPLEIFDKSRLNQRGHASLRIQSFITIERAFLNSFPFSSGFHSGYIDSDNINQVLFSISLLIEKGYVEGDRWRDVFNSFLQNIHFFRSDNSHIPKMLQYLRTYRNLANNKEYNEFYAETLVRLGGLGIGGTNVTPNETLQQYIHKEWETLLIEHPLSVVSQVRSMMKLFQSDSRFSDCIGFGGLALKQFQNDEIVDAIVDDREIRNYVLSAMQGITECFQLDYAIRSPEGSRSDVEGAAKFLTADNNASAQVYYFIELYEKLEMQGIFPVRHEGSVSLSETSRIREIKKYYLWFTNI